MANRDRSRNTRGNPHPRGGRMIRPATRRIRSSAPEGSILRNKKALLLIGASALAAIVILAIIIATAPGKGAPTDVLALHGSNDADARVIQLQPAATLPPRAQPQEALDVAPDPQTARDLSHGSQNIAFEERQINLPAIYGMELFFSAGTGAIDQGSVLKKLYIYNVETGQEQRIATSNILYGEYDETLINDKWLVWLETDYGKKNIITVMNRETGAVTKLKTCENGKPKLRMYGDILIWMEQVDTKEDKLYMVDLVSQENLSLFSFNDVATYGVSAPCIYQGTIVWAGPDPEPVEGRNTSAIYWVEMDEYAVDDKGQLNQQIFRPGVYVHEPLYNGEVFVWIDGNKSPKSRLYISTPNGTPTIIDENISTYSIGEGIVVYGKNSGVWLYVIQTGEICRLTNASEKGIMPYVQGRTVVWYNLSADSDKDVLRFKVLTDEELHVTPAEPTPTPAPTPTPTPDDEQATPPADEPTGEPADESPAAQDPADPGDPPEEPA